MNIENAEEEEQLFRAALEKGLEHFNRQEFHEAYDIWESRWHEEVTEGADLLQGLLQIAFAFSKIQNGNPKGAEKLLATGRDKLSLYGDEAYGLDISATLVLVQSWLERLEGPSPDGA